MGKKPSEILKEAKENVKRKQQEKKEETKMNNKRTIITTVSVTLAIVLAFAGTFLAGMNYESSKTKEIEARSEAKAASMVKPVQTEAAPSK